MNDPDITFPFEYPFMLLICNLLFWISLSIALGIIFKNMTKNKAVLVLGIYALIYGFFSKTGLFNYLPSVFTPSPDNHLSFLWVTCAIALAWFLRKRETHTTSYPHTYMPDIIAIVVFFLFCSNTHSTSKYIIGVALIFTVYLLIFLFQKWFILKHYNLYNIMIYVVVIGFSIACFLINSVNSPLYNNNKVSVRAFPKRPPLVLIVLDTLRADRLSLYGGPVPVPYLEAFARDATLFENCIANSSWTPPSHASLFTGLYPSEHGCISDFAPGKFPVLSGSLKTLAEIFQEHGYQTMGIVANFGYLGSGTNFDKGFQLYDCRKGIGSIFTDCPARPPAHLFFGLLGLFPKLIVPYVVGEDITTKVKLILDQCGTQEFFLFINYMDPHSPYYPPLPYAHAFTHDQMALWKRIAIMRTMGKNSSYNKFWLSQYDGEIAYLDAQLGALFAHLKEVDLYNNSLIIVTSDHGEMFGEHGLADHRCELYQEVVHVPLIVKLPGNKNAGSREKRILSLRDVFYLITDVCRIPLTDGQSSGDDFDFSAVTEFHDDKFGLQRAFYYQYYKYMTYEKNKPPQLFDLKRDPTEQHNVIQSYSELQKIIETKMQKWCERHSLQFTKEQASTSEEKADANILKRLRSLGYINK